MVRPLQPFVGNYPNYGRNFAQETITPHRGTTSVPSSPFPGVPEREGWGGGAGWVGGLLCIANKPLAD